MSYPTVEELPPMPAKVAGSRVYERPAVVYRLYGRNGRLLYVGTTSDLKRRMSKHRGWLDREEGVGAWYLRYTEFEDRREAEPFECFLIRALKPERQRDERDQAGWHCMDVARCPGTCGARDRWLAWRQEWGRALTGEGPT